MSDRLEAQVIDVVSKLVQELRGQGAPRQINPLDSLERDLGISSLERIELLIRLESLFKVRLGDAIMSEAETPRDLTRAILVADPSVRESWATVVHEPTIETSTPSSALTLVDALQWHFDRHPERVHIYLRQGDGDEIPLTYGDLWKGASDVAKGLVAKGLERNDTVALMLRTEEAFFTAFFGSLIAGGIPVPMYPPVRADRIEEYTKRQAGILRNAGTRMMITFAEVERVALLLTGHVPSLESVVTVDDLNEYGQKSPAVQWQRPELGNADPALIQYTSGSTDQPKGVLLSHANLLANIRAVVDRLEVKPNDVVVSWLPLYHDMGLIGAWLGSLYVGAPLAIMSPITFLARPARWLWSLHAHKATVSPAPNFAYDLCAHRINDEELDGLDLSAVRVLLNGSEVVQPETLSRFIARFKAYGLKPEALAPVYGLAECSVGLAAPPNSRYPLIDTIERRQFQETGQAIASHETADGILKFVACGRALPGHEIRVVDADGRRVDNRREGHVEFRGPSATTGYYRNPEATRELIQEDGWLKTGDLGYLVDDELFLTGRHKDLIIKAGRNLQPHEAEDIAAATPGVRKGCVAAFGVSDPTRGTERFVIVAETRLTDTKSRVGLESTIIERVTTSLGVPPDVVVLSPPGSVLKTSSGKIRRGATRDVYLTGRLQKQHRSVLLQWTRLILQASRGHVERWCHQVNRLIFTGWVGILLLLTVPFLWSALALGPKGSWVNRVVGQLTRLLFKLSGAPVTVLGLDNLKDVNAAVYVANHASYLDALLMMSVLPLEVRFAAKSSLASYPVLGTALRKGGHVLIEKSDLSKQIEGASDVLRPLQAGKSLFMFPEGTFVATSGLLPFRLGAFRAAVETGCPIVPVAIRGTRQMFPADTLLLRRTSIAITVGAPLAPKGTDWPEIVRLRDAAREMIASESGEPA